MTVQLKFEEANQKTILELLKSLQSLGVVTSFQIKKDGDTSEADSFFTELLSEGEENIKNGEVYTHEQVTEMSIRNF